MNFKEIAIDFVREEGYTLSPESEACLRALDVGALFDFFEDGGCVKSLIRDAAAALSKVDNYDGHVSDTQLTEGGAKWVVHADGGYRKLTLVLAESSADLGC